MADRLVLAGALTAASLFAFPLPSSADSCAPMGGKRIYASTDGLHSFFLNRHGRVPTGLLFSLSNDWADDVKKLTMPVMLVYGDSDMFRPEHIVKFYQLLGGGLKDAGWMREHMSKNRLAILPDLTHYEVFASPELARTILPFLDGKSGAKASEQVRK